jgi:CheY-like chemotaxis protein
VDGVVLKPVRRRDLEDVIWPHADRGPAAAVGDAGQGGSQRPSGPPVILLAEDNPVNQEVARGLLEALGCTVETVTNGAEAVEAASLHSYDLIFMDCMMPVMDGYLATAKLREKGVQARGGGRIPVVALTANAMLSDRERCLEAGMDDHLAKPYGIEAMKQTLNRWTRRTETEPA